MDMLMLMDGSDGRIGYSILCSFLFCVRDGWSLILYMYKLEYRFRLLFSPQVVSLLLIYCCGATFFFFFLIFEVLWDLPVSFYFYFCFDRRYLNGKED